jgi:hypothetical protein
MTSCKPESFGAKPVNLKWNAVRGDTAEIVVEFLENDEVSYVNTDGWDFVATAYDPMSETVYDLEILVSPGIVTVIAQPEVTSDWGVGYGQRVAEIAFDLEVTIGDVVWTPVIGTIAVAGDISGGNL